MRLCSLFIGAACDVVSSHICRDLLFSHQTCVGLHSHALDQHAWGLHIPKCTSVITVHVLIL